MAGEAGVPPPPHTHPPCQRCEVLERGAGHRAQRGQVTGGLTAHAEEFTSSPLQWPVIGDVTRERESVCLLLWAVLATEWSSAWTRGGRGTLQYYEWDLVH